MGLGVWGNMGPTIVRWEESAQPISDNLRTGLVLPVLSSATGLAFAAWLPPETTATFVDAELALDTADEFKSCGPRVPERLAQIRREGLVRLVGTDAFADLYGARISALSVPVFDPSGAMVLALTAIGAADQLDLSEEGRLVTQVRHSARLLSLRLGVLPPASPAFPAPSDDHQENTP
jgi:DNA-binding IclR family transcriptional regulator